MCERVTDPGHLTRGENGVKPLSVYLNSFKFAVFFLFPYTYMGSDMFKLATFMFNVCKNAQNSEIGKLKGQPIFVFFTVFTKELLLLVVNQGIAGFPHIWKVMAFENTFFQAWNKYR